MDWTITGSTVCKVGVSWLALQAQSPRSPLFSLLPMLVIFGIFYFVLMVPMRKRQRTLQQTIDNLKKGDRVLTTGGIFGEVSAVEPTSVLLKIADNVRVRVAKSAIAGLEADAQEASKVGGSSV